MTLLSQDSAESSVPLSKNSVMLLTLLNQNLAVCWHRWDSQKLNLVYDLASWLSSAMDTAESKLSGATDATESNFSSNIETAEAGKMPLSQF